MKILMIDNYDSFTYNLVHMLEAIPGIEVAVRRNDQLTIGDAAAFEKIILSPGPGIPSEAGIMPELVRTYAPTKSIFGVCLGHQCIGEVFGGLLLNIAAPIHGKATPITLTDRSEPLFKGLPERISVGRYHSWVVSQEKFPNELAITAVDEAGAIMALRHTRYDVCGVQFHPESILTQDGKMMLENWISYERAA